MSVFEQMTPDGFEQVLFCHDRYTGLRSIIAIHDTTLGPSLGGVRMWPYASEDEALLDCLRLARGMTYKAASAGVNLGGGKSVIIGDSRSEKTEALLKAHGRFIQTVGGRYIPGIDVGTDMSDLQVIATQAARVSCIKGDPSPATALGTLCGIRACLQAVRGEDDLNGVTIAVQGVGHVGAALVEMVSAGGARVLVSDIDRERVASLARRCGATPVEPDEIIAAECDVFAPCALGAVINDDSIPRLRCAIVAGSANNVLTENRHGVALHEAGILYAPDFCVNAGGLIFLEEEVLGHTAEETERRVRGVGELVARVIARARADGIPTSEAADRIAEERLASHRLIGPAYVSGR
jgi:leucine dehydrogenase